MIFQKIIFSFKYENVLKKSNPPLQMCEKYLKCAKSSFSVLDYICCQLYKQFMCKLSL